MVKILIVEKDLIAAKAIGQILEDEGFEVKIGCRSSKEAIDAFHRDIFDLVLISYFLGNNTKGVEVANHLLLHSTVPFIFIVSSVGSISLIDVVAARPKSVLFKPFNSFELITIVSVVLNNQIHSRIDQNSIQLNSSTIYSVVLNQVIEFIKTNVNEKIEVRKLNEMTPWSYDYFIKIFSKFIGLTPYKYILKKKIEKSKILLIETDYPIAEIAVMLSFENYSNYVNAFKREVKCNPLTYRKLNKKVHIAIK